MFNFKKSKTNEDEVPQKVSFFKKRSFKYGSMATVFTVVFVALIVLVNLGVSWASDRFPISVDLTTKKTYKLDTKSINYIRTLKQKITIDVLTTKDTLLNATSYAPIVKILEQYPQYNSNINVEYVDLNKSPTYQSKYSSETLSEGDVIVTTGTRYKHLAISDLVETTYDSTTYSQSITGITAEQVIDTALLYVTTTDLPIVTFTTGHSEADSSALQNVLKKSNYTIETKNLSSDGVDTKAKAIAIVSPTADFTTAEITKLDSFLTNDGAYGKSLFVFFNPQQANLPNLESYLKEWGIGVGTGVVYDTSNAIGTDYFEVLNGTADSDTLGTLRSNASADLAISRPLSLLFSSKGEYTTTSVLSSMDTSRLWNPTEINSTTAASFQPNNNDKAGPFTVMAKSVKQSTYNNAMVASNVMVSGTTDAFNNSGLLSESNLNNADMITNAFNKLVGGPTLNMNISTKDTTDTSLNLTAAQIKFLELLFIIFIPLFVLILGLVVWLRRRHL